MIDKFNEYECCGCSYCASICPTDAIEMVQNFKGFYYPKINEKKCIGCNLCEKECIFNNDTKFLKQQNNYYVARTKDKKTLSSSTSGGVFSVISDLVLENKGIVIGAVFDKDFNVKHDIAFSKEDRDKMRGSKYIQSDIRKSFKWVDEYIENKLILFVGTPCQVIAIKNYVLKKHSKFQNHLITIDIICHGVPSPFLWRDHLSLLTNIKELEDISCRSKKRGWHSHLEVYTLKNGNILTSSDKGKRGANTGKMVELFYKALSFRESCSKCVFTSMDRIGDFTIGDAWGIDKADNQMDDNLGWNLLFVNTDSAKLLLNKINDKIDCKEINDMTFYMQPQLQHPITLNKKYIIFWEDYKKNGAEYCFKKYTTLGFKNRVVYNTKNVIKKVVRK